MGPDSGQMMMMMPMPMIFIGIVIAIFAFYLARRKGESAVMYCILAFIPLVGLLSTIWLASKTDKNILDRLGKMEAISDITGSDPAL